MSREGGQALATPNRENDVIGVMLLALLLLAIMAAEVVLPLHRQPAGGRGRLVTNFGLGAINAVLLLGVPLGTIAAAGWAAQHGVGLLNRLPLGWWPAAVLTVATRSLMQYGLHRLSHAVPWLWRIHRIHHADTAIDLATGFRNHPLELAVVLPPLCVAAAALGWRADALTGFEIVAALFSLCSHANVHLPDAVDRLLRLVLVTPAMHHVHHAADRRWTDSNYGDVFSGWDRLFGTYTRAQSSGVRAMRIGLGAGSDTDADNLSAQLTAPLRRQPTGEGIA